VKIQFPTFLAVTFLAAHWAVGEETLSAVPAAPLPAIAAPPTPGKLLISPCTAAVPLGKATLRVSGMTRNGGVYTGDYQIKVTPLFFASEKGHLSVAVSDDTLRKLTQGKPINFNGTATTTGSGKTRAVNGIATPSTKSEGRMEMWFTADGNKKGFTSTYRFAEK
jgi:hypothetical protein